MIIVLSAILHATLQLSVSVFTLLSGHKISQNSPHRHLMKLSTAFLAGVFSITILLFSSLSFLASNIFEISRINNSVLWSIIIGLISGLSVSIWVFYFKNGNGTKLWLPDSLAGFFITKTKKARHSAEAFSLGLSSVLLEWFFILPPIFASAIITTHLIPPLQIVALITYVSIAHFPLFSIYVLISGGHPIASVQQWRERNKKFIQLISSLCAAVLAFYIFSVLIWRAG